MGVLVSLLCGCARALLSATTGPERAAGCAKAYSFGAKPCAFCRTFRKALRSLPPVAGASRARAVCVFPVRPRGRGSSPPTATAPLPALSSAAAGLVSLV